MDKDYDIKIRDDFFDDDDNGGFDFDGENGYGGQDGYGGYDDYEERPVRRRRGDYRNHKRNHRHEDKNYDRRKNYDGRKDFDRAQRPSGKKKKKKNKAKGCLTFFIVFAAVLAALFFLVSPPKKTVFLIAGTDAGGTRTDTLMLGVLKSGAKSEIELISIPRDTLVSVSDNTYEKMCAEYPQPAGHGMKINEIYHFAGEKMGMSLLIDEIEDKFGVKIDYYAKVDFDGLHAIVDSIGGVEFYVPQDMDYDDPVQNLSIHLKEGEQVLDGSHAEQLLRYRAGYARADLQRVEVQQNFMKTLVLNLAKPANIIKNNKAYLDFYNNHVDTNLSFVSAVKYVKCAFSLKGESIKTDTMPGQTGTKFGRSGYLADVEKFNELYGALYK